MDFVKTTTSFLLEPDSSDASADANDLEELLEDDPEPVDQSPRLPPVLS